MNHIEKYIENHVKKVEKTIEELGKIPAPSHKEEKRAKYCKEWFEKNTGLTAFIDEAKNVICEYNPENSSEWVVFCAHMDVVFPDETELPMRRENNLLYAPGIGDDTANLVNMMYGAKYIAECEKTPTKGILFVANSCEEGLGNLKGTRAVFEKYGDKITEFCSFDAYLGSLTNEAVGSHRYEITVKTEGGHSYANFGNNNAIHALSKIICKLYDMQVPSDLKVTYNVGEIKGGTSVNTIAQECKVSYEYRSEFESSLLYMKDEFYKIIDEFKNSYDVEITTLGERPGSLKREDNLLEKFTEKNVEHIKKYYDREIWIGASSTDSNIPLSKGILANTIGTIKGSGAHTREEVIDLNSIPQGLGIVLSIMNDYVK